MAIVTTAHLLEFGKIVHFYASVEWGIRCMLAGILETPLVEALVVTEPYSALNLKNVAKSAVKLSKLPEKDQKAFVQIVGDWSSFGPLRNAIAHNRWQTGTREGSIAPFRVDIRSGSAKLIGAGDDRDWTAAELASEAMRLHHLNERAKKFYAESGLAAVMEAKDAERSPKTA